MKSTFTKRWDPENGYSLKEAQLKAISVNNAHEVGKKHSKWNPAQIVPDPNKERGYMVIIETIEKIEC